MLAALAAFSRQQKVCVFILVFTRPFSSVFLLFIMSPLFFSSLSIDCIRGTRPARRHGSAVISLREKL